MALPLRLHVQDSADGGWDGVRGLRIGDRFETPAQVLKTGYPSLDDELPGGGWPAAALIEIFSAPQQVADWQLIAPALAHQLADTTGAVLMVQPPYEPCGKFLQHRGVPAQRICKVVVEDVLRRLWVCEQALQCADVSAVLAWLPGVAYPALRRLHVAAGKKNVLFWTFRPKSDLSVASPAALRILAEQRCIEGLHHLELRILKRRGPPLDRVLILPAADARLADVLKGRGKIDGGSYFDAHELPLQQSEALPSDFRLPFPRARA